MDAIDISFFVDGGQLAFAWSPHFETDAIDIR